MKYAANITVAVMLALAAGCWQTDTRTDTVRDSVEHPTADGGKIVHETTSAQAHADSHVDAQEIAVAVAAAMKGGNALTGGWGDIALGATTLLTGGLAYVKHRQATTNRADADAHKADADEAWNAIKDQATSKESA